MREACVRRCGVPTQTRPLGLSWETGRCRRRCAGPDSSDFYSIRDSVLISVISQKQAVGPCQENLFSNTTHQCCWSLRNYRELYQETGSLKGRNEDFGFPHVLKRRGRGGRRSWGKAERSASRLHPRRPVADTVSDDEAPCGSHARSEFSCLFRA